MLVENRTNEQYNSNLVFDERGAQVVLVNQGERRFASVQLRQRAHQSGFPQQSADNVRAGIMDMSPHAFLGLAYENQ